MPLIHFTQSVSLSGTDSFAWNSPSNWVGGTLPVPIDSVVINQPAGSHGVSYDNYQLTGPLLSLAIPSQSPSPVLEIASGITLLVTGALTNSGTVDIDSGAILAVRREAANELTNVGTNAEMWLPNFLNTGIFDYGPSADIFLTAAQPVWHGIATNTIGNFGVGDALFLHGFPFTNGYDHWVATVSGTTLKVAGVIHGKSTLVYELSDFNTIAGVTGITTQVVHETNPLTGVTGAYLELLAVCFVAGTQIATERGEVAVEDLRGGDQVLTAGPGGPTSRPIRWIGQRRLDLTAHPRPDSLFPIRIRRGAFADNVPHRDLLVSPDHCLFVDGELIPAKLLVNAMTIVQDRSSRGVHYYHIELDCHDVLLAEGAPTESYLNTGNRDFFANTDGPLTLHPELEIDAERLRWQDQLCAPLRLSSAEIEPAWQRLAARAEALGYRHASPAVTLDPDLRLVARGREFRPIAIEGSRYVFVLPGGVSDIRIASRSDVPVAANRRADDWRRLGVAVGQICIRVGDERIDIPADHPALIQGWHPAERDAAGLRRWTDGNAALGLAVPDGVATVEIHLAGTTPYTLDQDTAASLAA
jgi:hypothetical protein